MKYRFAALLVVLALIFSSFGFASVTPTPAQEASEAAIAYLEEAAYAEYCNQEHTLEERTIASLPETDAQILSQVSADYATFRNAQPVLPYEEASIDTGSMEALRDNLSLHWDSVAYYQCVDRLYGITYDYFVPSYQVVSCTVDGRYAAVELYETLDFQYSFRNTPSMMTIHYFLSLLKHEGAWLVASVESDHPFYQAYRETDFDLTTSIAGLEMAARQREEQAVLTADIAEKTTSRPGDVVEPMTNGLNRPYDGQKAANYAMTYRTRRPSGSEPNNYKNGKFYWTTNSCQLFASQCVWAGFGGSDDQSSINNKYGMDASGSNQWWSTDSDVSSGTWASCSNFRNYVAAVSGSQTESGIVGVQYYVSASGSNLSGSSGIGSADLLGAVLHIDGGVSGDGPDLGHAVVVTEATGTDRWDVVYQSYNGLLVDIVFGRYHPAGGTWDVQVIIPRNLRNGTGATADYLNAPTQREIALGNNSGVEKTLSAYATVSGGSPVISVYPPDATTPRYTFTSTNRMTVNGTVVFNQIGDWKVVVSGSGLRSYTYVVRVVQQLEGNG